MKRLILLGAVLLAALAIVFAPYAANAQTVRKTRIRNVVEDSVCAPGTGWETRPQRYTSATAASIAARTKLTCAVTPPPPPPIDTTPVPPPPPPPPVGQWTTCTPIGNTCAFSGIRDVRLVTASGIVRATALRKASGVQCYSWNLEGINVPQQDGARCEVGPAYVRSIVNPSPGMAGSPAVWVVPVTDTGSGRELIRSGAPSGAISSQPKFRTKCDVSTYAVFDPIVYPGQSNVGHLHSFAGNTAVNPNSTSESLASSGNSTCQGGTLNRTAYWVPAMFNRRTGKVITQREMNAYYTNPTWAPTTGMQTMPIGLKIIAGNKDAAGTQPGVVEWQCYGTPAFTQQTGYIPQCSVGGEVVLVVTFPNCWDGRNLDSPNHASHMAYMPYPTTVCPASHPVKLPMVIELFHFPIEPGEDTRDWALSSDHYNTGKTPAEAFGLGGRSAHADWFFAGKRLIDIIVPGCLLANKNCEVGWLGDGREVFYP